MIKSGLSKECALYSHCYVRGSCLRIPGILRSLTIQTAIHLERSALKKTTHLTKSKVSKALMSTKMSSRKRTILYRKGNYTLTTSQQLNQEDSRRKFLNSEVVIFYGVWEHLHRFRKQSSVAHHRFIWQITNYKPMDQKGKQISIVPRGHNEGETSERVSQLRQQVVIIASRVSIFLINFHRARL